MKKDPSKKDVPVVEVIFIIAILVMLVNNLTGCTVTPAKLQGPTYEESWRIERINPAIKPKKGS